MEQNLEDFITNTLTKAGMPLHVSAFLPIRDIQRATQIISTLHNMSEAKRLWYVDLEDDTAMFGLPTHYKPESADEAWELIDVDPKDYPVNPPVYDDGATQGTLGFN